MTGRRVLTIAVGVLALVLIVGRWCASLYTEHLWYASLGASEVWRAKVSTTAALTATSFAVAALFAFVNLFAVRRSVVSLVLPRRIGNIEIGEEVPGSYLNAAVTGLSLVVAALLTFPSEHWHTAFLARIGRPFGETDPYFLADLGFYVYWLPFETAVHFWAILVLVSVTVLVVVMYALTPSLRWERGTLHVSAYVRRHFTILGAVLLFVLAWSYRLSMYRLLSVGGGTGGVFTELDHRVIIPATLLLSVVTLCAAFIVAWAGWTGQSRLAFGAVSAVLLLSLVGRTIAPLLFRRGGDPASRVSSERYYVATRLSFTRRAYAVDRMRAESLGTGFASRAEAATHLAVWDGATLARAAERLRRVRVVGDGASWQTTESGIAALLVERSSEGAPDARDVWSIGRFDPSSADERGLPRRVAGTAMGGDELLVGEPAVYDSAPSYSVLADSLRQLAGVEMVSTRSRLVHAWALQNFRLLFGDLPSTRPIMVRRRAVRDRVRALVPFLVQGSEVVPVVSEDSLYWVIELYAASGTYPLAQRFSVLGEDRGYLQHAATALVHSASGRVRMITSPSPDPVATSWAAAFPRLFVSQTALSPALRAMLPPLSDAARTQALAFAAAGFRGDSLEIRHFATLDGADSAAAREPTHAAMTSLGGIALLWPLLDTADRVRGVVAATSGAVRATSWIPMANDRRRWGTVVDQLRTADTAVHENALVRHSLRVVPVMGRAMYVQPTFQLRPGATPTLLRVSALFEDSVQAGATLAASLGVARSSPSEPVRAADFRLHADSLYRVMRNALARGDWTAFGRAFDALGLALRITGR